MRSAIAIVREPSDVGVNFSPIVNEDDLKAEFSALILRLPNKRVARAADCSPDTVKCWKAERSFPQGRHLMRLAQEFPKVRTWFERRTGGMSHPRSMAEMFALLEQMMLSNTPEGRAMRARFQQIVAEQRNV